MKMTVLLAMMALRVPFGSATAGDFDNIFFDETTQTSLR
jgi:hypothetical protein